FSDETTQDTLIAQITRSNGSRFNTTMSLLTGNTYNASILTTIGDSPGQWNITFIGNDTNTNTNNTIQTNFTVNDNTVPRVTNISPSSGLSFNQSTNISISANVTDNFAVDTVLANVTLPNGTIRSITLRNNSGNIDIWNNTFTETRLPGTYNVTFIANDTRSNINSSVTTFFISNDTTNPTVISTGCAPFNGNTSNIIRCTATIIDESIISVLANVTASTGTLLQQTISNNSATYNFSFSTTQIVGQYNVTWFARDSTGNFNRSNDTFSINDPFAPRVTSLEPVLDSNLSVNDSIRIAANVTDTGIIDTVQANITLPNGSIVILILSNSTKDIYNSTFNNTQLNTTYSVIFIANDSSANTNATQRTNFTLFYTDVSAPTIITPICTPFNLLINQSTFCNATITDNTRITEVIANITQPDGNILNNITNTNTTIIFNLTFTNTSTNGTYTVRWFAKDPSNNTQNSTTTFIVGDTRPPNITLIRPIQADNFTQLANVNITANVSDDLGLSTVTANITRPDSSILTIQLFNGSPFQGNFITTLDGNYTLRVIANDTTGNTNISPSVTIITNDTLGPAIIVIVPQISTNFIYDDIVVITARINDSTGVSNASINITYPTGIVRSINLSNTTATTFTNTFATNNEFPSGTYTIRFIATDLFGYRNDTVTTTFILNPPQSGDEPGGGGGGGREISAQALTCGYTCTIGEQRCNNNGVEICSTNQSKCPTWEIIQQCSTDELCNNSNCIAACTEDWECTTWNNCTTDLHQRSCVDKNNCNTTKTQPSLIESCSEISSNLSMSAAAKSIPTLYEQKTKTLDTTKNILFNNLWWLLMLIVAAGYSYYLVQKPQTRTLPLHKTKTTLLYKIKRDNHIKILQTYKTLQAYKTLQTYKTLQAYKSLQIYTTQIYKHISTILVNAKEYSHNWILWLVKKYKKSQHNISSKSKDSIQILDPNKTNTLFVPYHYVTDASIIIKKLTTTSHPNLSSYPPVVVTLCKKALIDASKGKQVPIQDVRIRESYDYIGYSTLINLIHRMARGRSITTNIPHQNLAITKTVEEYIDLGQISPELETFSPNTYIHKIEILTQQDLRHALKHIRSETCVLLINIHNLRTNKPEQFKTYLKEIKRVVQIHSGDMLALGERSIIATSRGISIEKRY
ncbi:MAG: hypothetical protein AABX52_04730, partial [Nanoarchaeota archaeon]